jgi:phosphotriesterase-related protein
MTPERKTDGIAMTVDGPVPAEALGITLVHEHLLIDLRCWQNEPRTDLQRLLADEPLRMEMLGEVRRDPLVFGDNLVIDDIHLAVEEVGHFEALGGRTIVDVTCIGLGPQPKQLKEIARRSGVKVIAGCGYYVRQSHPSVVEAKGVDALAAEFLHEIETGLGGTDVRPGVIGEIGTSEPVDPQEWRVLEAACCAQLATGLPLSVHVHPMQGRTAPEVVGFILEKGVTPSRVIVSHMDGTMDLEYQIEVAETGVYVAYDCFGLEVYFDCYGRYRCHDSERERLLLALLERGYERQLLLSQDVCMKAQLRHFGGYGYDHVLRHIVPSLERQGVTAQTLRTMLLDNPRRAFTIGNPPIPTAKL